MDLAPDINGILARARSDLRMGLAVALTGAPGQGALMLAAETLRPEALAALRSSGLPLDLAVTARRAATLKARAYDGSLARLRVPSDAIPAWIAATADPAADLHMPMKGPYDSRREGDPALHALAIDLAKSARLLPAAVLTESPDAAAIAARQSLTCVPLGPARQALEAETRLDHVVQARVPLAAAPEARLHVFRPRDGSEEHYAIEIGQPHRGEPVLARLHSACFTGDLLGSLKCDCGPQLDAALRRMAQEGSGLLLYLNQEGRGIGLANKMRAYSLQDQGFDTVEANHRLGFEDDERDFRIGADILRTMGFNAVRLMTNNPAKIEMMEKQGIAVTEREPLHAGETAQNRKYLATKQLKSGHLPE